jgi:hypothetical protein
VKPFVKRQKNDADDVEVIVEAASHPAMRTVSVKSSKLLRYSPSLGRRVVSFRGLITATDWSKKGCRYPVAFPLPSKAPRSGKSPEHGGVCGNVGSTGRLWNSER